MDEINGKWIVQNGELILASNAKIVLDKSFYEVIRVCDGKIIFLEEHLDRLMKSIEKAKVNLNFDKCEIEKWIKILKAKLNISNQNIKIVVERSENRRISIYPLESHYPADKLYREGIEVDWIKVQRKNPEIKLWNQNYKTIVNNAINENNVFEVLLCDDDGFITEGSKSNVFFIMKGEVFTAPKSRVLNGITRQKVIEAIEISRVKLIERELSISDLNKVDGAFLTGTSLNILPIRRIGTKEFELSGKTLALLEKIMSNYNRILHD